MLHTTFAHLSKAQKRYAVILFKYRPDRDESGVISSSFVRKLHHELLANRANGGEKIGWPRWVFVENKTGESEGFVPFPTPEEVEAFEKAETEQSARKVLQTKEPTVQLNPEASLITDEEFEAECLAAGIKF